MTASTAREPSAPRARTAFPTTPASRPFHPACTAATASLVTSATEIAQAQSSGRIPVLVPYRWLREIDPLPHSWDVTSDSIAAWYAGVAGASQVVLIKPSGASGGDVVDRYFGQALPPGVSSACVPADEIDRLLTAGDLRQYSNTGL